MVTILFTTTDSLISTAIRKVTGEDCSHVAVKVGDFVVHADFFGVGAMSYSEFCESRTIVREVKIPLHATQVWAQLEKHDEANYDFGAFLWIGANLLLRSWFKIPLPKVNLWQTTGMYICTEWVTSLAFREEQSMLTPGQLYTKLKEAS